MITSVAALIASATITTLVCASIAPLLALLRRWPVSRTGHAVELVRSGSSVTPNPFRLETALPTDSNVHLGVCTGRNEDGVYTLLTLSPKAAQRNVVASGVAASVGARTGRESVAPFSTAVLSRLKRRGGVWCVVGTAERDPDPIEPPTLNGEELQKAMEKALSPGDFLYVTFRRPKKGEARPRHLMTLILIGAANRSAAEQLAAIIAPTIDPTGRGWKLVRVHGGQGILVSSVPLIGAAITGWVGAATTVTAALFGVSVALLLAEAVRIPITHTSFVRRALEEGRIPGPPRLAVRTGRRPSSSPSIPMPVSAAVTLLVPSDSGAASQSGSTAREDPEKLLAKVGPRIGLSVHTGRPIHLPAESLKVGIFGVPGSGKSVLVRLLWAHELLAKRKDPAAHRAMIALETKGSGAAKYCEWAEKLELPCRLVDLMDESTAAIDMFGEREAPLRRAEDFVDAMVAAWGDQAIGDRSYPALLSAFAGALCVDDDVAAAAGVRVGSPVWYAYLLLGGQGDGVGLALFTALLKKASKEGGSGLVEAVEHLARFYGAGVTASARKVEFGAASNKVQQLLAADSWFSPTRERVTFASLLAGGETVVVNTGMSDRVVGDRFVGDRLASILAAMLLHQLKVTIERRCNGWLAAGRSVTVYADELSDVAGADPETVVWLREKGRDRGVRLVFASQRPEQLDPAVRASVRAFDTVVWMRLNDRRVCEEAAEDLSLGGERWDASDVVNLELFTGAVRTSVGGVRLPTAVVLFDFWEEGPVERFLEVCG